MNLNSTVTLHAGGPGSGCKGSNCGRPSSISVKVVESRMRKTAEGGKAIRLTKALGEEDEVYGFVLANGDLIRPDPERYLIHDDAALHALEALGRKKEYKKLGEPHQDAINEVNRLLGAARIGEEGQGADGKTKYFIQLASFPGTKLLSSLKQVFLKSSNYKVAVDLFGVRSKFSSVGIKFYEFEEQLSKTFGGGE